MFVPESFVHLILVFILSIWGRYKNIQNNPSVSLGLLVDKIHE